TAKLMPPSGHATSPQCRCALYSQASVRQYRMHDRGQLAQGLRYPAHGKAATEHPNCDRVVSQWCPCIPQIEKAVNPTADHYEGQSSKHISEHGGTHVSSFIAAEQIIAFPFSRIAMEDFVAASRLGAAN